MPPSARRPGPLQELPLSCFHPIDINVRLAPESPYKSSSKRSRSPSALLSPTKRRILREEGCFGSFSSELRRSSAKERTADQYLPEILRSSRPLDLGSLPKASGGSVRGLDDDANANPFSVAHPRTPRSITPPRELALFPVLAASPSSCCSRTSAGSDETGLAAAPIMIPRELPPSPNRQCFHYPGFDIHRDTHIELLSACSRASVDPSLDSDKEGFKENLPPRKKAKKLASTMEVGTSSILSKKGNDRLNTSSYSMTPQHKLPCLTLSTPHVHSTPRACAPLDPTPVRVTTPEGKSVFAGKRAMELEVDDICSDGGVL